MAETQWLEYDEVLFEGDIDIDVSVGADIFAVAIDDPLFAWHDVIVVGDGPIDVSPMTPEGDDYGPGGAWEWGAIKTQPLPDPEMAVVFDLP